jgi:hypothetical protein
MVRARGMWSAAKTKSDLLVLYSSVLPTVTKIARDSGYAVGLHGSMTRDLDLIAIPWQRKHVLPITLARRIFAIAHPPRIERAHFKAILENVTRKPCGRLAFAIYIGFYAYIDLSVMAEQKGEG